MSSQNITIPERIVKKAKELGIDITDIVIETLAEKLGIDPVEELEARTELAKKYLEEGIRLTDSNPVQASEKLYKAAEEAVKAAAKILNLPVISNVKERGRWTATDLEKAVETLSKKYGEQIILWWDAAWTLHVWGFHEAKLDSEAVRTRIPYIEKMIQLLDMLKTRSTPT
ncbi:archaeal PaREP1/PaREP8 family [Desulfurococcaceae archaeon AG1]|jgi:hypothetical protein|nr:archaeal PaREP1/PaREP8 family [Desulfurococcaceae archaeon AG1]